MVGHRCLKSQLYQLIMKVVGEENEPEVFSDCFEVPENVGAKGELSESAISLHAMLGTSGYQTMKLHGVFKGHNLIILVDEVPIISSIVV